MKFDPKKLAIFAAGCALLLAVATGCSSSKIGQSEGVPSTITAEEVPWAIENAKTALAQGRSQEALDWMRAATELRYLPHDQRVEVQRLLETAADRMIAELGEDDDDPEVLKDILELGLPRQIAVTGALRAAEMMVNQERYEDAYDVIREVDRLFPTHHMRPEAGRILVTSGLALSYDDSGWFLDDPRDAALAALEYASIHYPTARDGDKVLRRLSEMYEEDKKWHLAIDRHEELVQSFPDSPLVPYSLARIPHLKLASIESPEYDRNALIDARQELEDWLRNYPGHEITEQVRHDLDDALVRLCVSDLAIASFYSKIKNPTGVRHHAQRALEEALAAGDEDRADKARNYLAQVGEPEELP